MWSSADVIFPVRVEQIVEQHLTLADPVLSRLATEYRCRFRRDGGRGWLGRRLRKRVGLRTYELKLLLNPDFFQNEQTFYYLSDQWMYDWGELYTRLIEHHVVATFQPTELADTTTLEQVLRARLVAAFSR